MNVFLNFNQVIYSSSPISWPSFKPLAQIVFEISCWQDFVQIFSKGHNSRKGDNSDKEKKYRSAVFPWEIHIRNFRTLACMVHKIWHDSDFVRIFSKGHNSRKGDNSEKKKKLCVNYFSMRNRYMKFQNTSMHGFWWMDGQPETNMLPKLLRSWGHNEIAIKTNFQFSHYKSMETFKVP